MIFYELYHETFIQALGLWGRLQQAKTKLELSQEPKRYMSIEVNSTVLCTELRDQTLGSSNTGERTKYLYTELPLSHTPSVVLPLKL